MILILGRSGSGKDTVAKFIEKHYRKRVLKSYTNRPKRHPSENTHVFLDKEELDQIHGRVCQTEINGYLYFATKIQMLTNDVYVIDPNGMRELLSNMPDMRFNVIYVKADNETRKERILKRLNNEEIYQAREQSEAWQFTKFEEEINNGKYNVDVIDNSSDMAALEQSIVKILG